MRFVVPNLQLLGRRLIVPHTPCFSFTPSAALPRTLTSPSPPRHPLPPAIIRHAVWLYLRFTLSYRYVEDLLAERGLDVSYETVRR